MVDQASNVLAWRELHDGGYFDQREQYCTYTLESEVPLPIAGLLPVIRAVDIGCGYGRFMAPIIGHVEELIGIDVHPVPLAMGRKLLGRITGAQFLLTDGKELPLAAGSVDLVYSVSAFQHMPVDGVLRYIDEIARVLSANGHCAIQFLHGQRTAEHFAGGEDSIAWSKSDALAAFRRASLNVSASIIAANTGISLWICGGR